MNILDILLSLKQYRLDAETIALFGEFVRRAKSADDANEFIKSGLTKALDGTTVKFTGSLRG